MWSPVRRECALKPLSPREIQLRVRAGASPEAIASETGWALDRVQRYADQILIERAWVAERARQVELRSVDGPVTLGETAESVVYAEGFDPQDITWDSWRRPDGRWVVTAEVDVDSRVVRGSWTYDVVGRTINPLDEAAGWFMGASQARIDHLAEQPLLTPRTDRAARPRLVAVHDEAQENDVGESPDAAHPAGQTTGSLVPQEQPRRQERQPRSKGRKRASVPSWDEILFGATRGED